MKRYLYHWQLLIILCITAATYVNALHNPFIWDDEVQILGNPLVTSQGNLKNIFLSTFMAKGSGATGSFYRPLTIVIYHVCYRIFGPHSLGFHTVSLFFHLINIILIYFLTSYLIKKYLPLLHPKWPALIISLLFAVHPVNVEAVSWISSMGDVIGFTFFLTGFVLLSEWIEKKGWYLLLLGQIIIFSGLFIKESIIMFYPIFFIYCLIAQQHKNKKFFRILAFIFSSAIPIVLYFITRYVYANIHVTPPLSLISNASFTERCITLPFAIVSYLKLIFFPLHLCTEYHFVVRNVVNYKFLFSVVILSVIGITIFKLRRKTSPLFSFWIFWFLIGLFPTLNILHPLDRTIAERWLYMPFYGILAIMITSIAIAYKNTKAKTIKTLILAVLVTTVPLLSLRCAMRNRDWHDALYLYQHDAQLSPYSFILQNNMGVELFRRKQIDAAQRAFKKSLEIEEHYGIAHNNLGAIYEFQNKLQDAEKEYIRAIQLSEYILSYINLAKLCYKHGRLNYAILVLETAFEQYPQNSEIQTYLHFLQSARDKKKGTDLF